MHPRQYRLPTAVATVAGLALTGLALVPSPASATDSTPGYSMTPILIDVLVGPAGDQPCRVSADLYKPDRASRKHRAPAILTTNGFGGDKADANQLAVAKGFVNQGYVVLSYSGLGFGTTTCRVSLDQPAYDGKAGKQLVDVLAGTRAYTPEAGGAPVKVDYVAQEKKGDPRVGMIGGSYGGQIQYAVAAQDRRIDALIPIITWNNLSYSLAPNNTSLGSGVSYTTPGVAKREWVDLFFSAGILSGAQNVQTAGDPDTLVGCPNFVTAACPAVVQLNAAGYPDASLLALGSASSVASYVHRVKAPTLLVQGQKDTLFNLQEAVATYRSLRGQGTPTRMIWQSWGHSSSKPAPGELDFGAASIRDSYLGRRFLSWMNHYVRGNAKAPVGPRFSYFRDWVRYDTSPAKAGKAVARAYKTQKKFFERPTATLWFSGSNALVRGRASVAAGSASYANVGPAPTSYSETSGLEGNQVNNPPSDAPGTSVAFTSPALTRSAVIVGSSRLTLHLSAPTAALSQRVGPAGQLVLFAKIYDVAPDGTKVLHDRLVSPVRVSDVTRPVSIRLPGVVQRFAAGHRIQVVVAASDLAYGSNAAPQPVTITTSPTAPSSLAMPLTGKLRF